jgi:hypothetical protein
VAGQRLPPDARPFGLTTKEYNSRVHKHMGTTKCRCYNRGNDRFLCFEQIFQCETSGGNAAKLGARRSSGEASVKEDSSKEDHLVRIIE